MKGSTIASYPNRAYICHDCGRNLGNRYSRLRGKKQPDVIIINGKHYCSKCADKHFNDQRLNRVILLTQIANNQPYTHEWR